MDNSGNYSDQRSYTLDYTVLTILAIQACTLYSVQLLYLNRSFENASYDSFTSKTRHNKRHTYYINNGSFSY